MALNEPSSELKYSAEESAIELLENLVDERGITAELMRDSERIAFDFVRVLDTAPADQLTPSVILFRERARVHLEALRAFRGGGFELDTRES